jgi:hypothetical protein
MPLNNFTVEVTGDAITTETAAALTATAKTETDFSTPSTAATSGARTASAAPTYSFLATSTAGARVGTGATDTDFSGGHAASYAVKVDGGGTQTVTLNLDYGTVAALKTAINAQLVGATVTGTSTLTITSNTKGHLSSIQTTKTIVDSELKITDGTTTGLASQKIIVEIDGGAAQTIYLETNFADLAALMTAMQAAITGATFSVNVNGNRLVLTSDTTGTSSRVNITTVTSQSTPTAGFATGNTAGVDEVSAFNAAITVDGGSSQPIELDADYGDWDTLVAELNDQTDDCTWSVDQFGFLTVTSDTTGNSSEIEFVITTNSTDLYIAEDDVTGTEVTTTGATRIWPPVGEDGGGSATMPQQVQVQNPGDDGDMATGANIELGGENVTFGEGIIVRPGASETVPLEVFEKLCATADDSVTVTVRVLVTRA